MKSSNSQASLGFSLSVRKTRKAIFLEQMDRVVPWSRLVDLIAALPGRSHRSAPFELETMLRTHFLQQWFNLSDPAMEEAFFDTPLEHPFRVIMRQFGYLKICYRGLKKNAAQIATLFALSNLWMARHDLMGARA
jgi:hypothetical protein